MTHAFSGSLVALITPFSDGCIDFESLRNLIEWQISEGTHGIVPVGTTGESPTLSNEEHKKMIEFVVECVNSRVPVIAGCGSNSTTEAVAFHKYAADIGADGALHVTGYYNRPSEEGLIGHFSSLNDAAQLPIIVYNTPPRTGIDITPDVLLRLSELTNITGIKDATADLARICLERMLMPEDFVFLSGEDMTALAYNISGGHGCISVSANVAPALCAKMQNACRDEDFREAKRIHSKLAPLHRELFLERSPSGVKFACSLLGLCSEELRLPLTPISEITKNKIFSTLSGLVPNLKLD